MSDIVKEILRVVSSSLQVPTIIILILLILLTILMLGSFVAEIFTERRSLKMNIPGLVDQLQGKNSAEMKEAIENSDLLNRQKESCRELINRGGYTDDTREALARQLIADEEIRYGRIVKITDLVSRVAPMFGLMGTLIPLGPGLIALGQGDTSTLSSSLLIAFDTTVAGLISGAISYVISGIRKNWYEEYMIGLETIMETILDVQSGERGKTEVQLRGQGKPSAPAAQGAKATDPKKPAQKQPQGQGTAQKPNAEAAKPATPGAPRPAAPGAPRPAAPGAAKPAQPQPKAPAQPTRPQTPARPETAPINADPAPETLKAEDIYENVTPEPVKADNFSSRRETMTQPVQPAAGPTAEQMSRNTQTQAHSDSKTSHTMVQRTFQEEVRAAEQAMLEAQMRSGEQAGQILRRPEGN